MMCGEPEVVGYLVRISLQLNVGGGQLGRPIPTAIFARRNQGGTAVQYLKNVVNKKQTPQSEPIPDSGQVPNSAGGHTWAVDDWTRLERFLVLGSEGGSYYARERKLTDENIDSVKRCINNDGERTVRTVVAISEGGRAPKNDPALFVLAVCASAADERTRGLALDALPKVARIGTHLFHFVEFVDKMRGWGPALKKAVAGWYLDKEPYRLAYQVVKYQQRDGWSHRDLLRLCHAEPKEGHEGILRWVVKGEVTESAGKLIQAFEEAKTADEKRTIELIGDHSLTHEMIKTEHLKSPKVWEALLEGMPMTAMVRSLGRMGSVGLLKPMSEGSKTVCERLGDLSLLHKSRIHPIQVLMALLTYRSGKGVRGDLSWDVVPQISDALDRAFYSTFQNIDPSGKKFYLGLDVSGSMSWGNVAGSSLTPRVGAAAMAMVTARTESLYYMAGFTSEMVKLDITAQDSLQQVVCKTDNLPFGTTDCAQPMLDALKKGILVDVFVIYTDNETWCGDIHPSQALQMYRNKIGIPAKLIVVGMISNGFSIADPNDPWMMDVVGFDTNTPAVISDFATH